MKKMNRIVSRDVMSAKELVHEKFIQANFYQEASNKQSTIYTAAMFIFFVYFINERTFMLGCVCMAIVVGAAVAAWGSAFKSWQNDMTLQFTESQNDKKGEVFVLFFCVCLRVCQKRISSHHSAINVAVAPTNRLHVFPFVCTYWLLICLHSCCVSTACYCNLMLLLLVHCVLIN